MTVYHRIEEYRPTERGACVALGFFDGVHLGHRAVIGGCVSGKGDLPCVVLTFAESPAAVLGRPVPPLLTDNAQKAALLEELGADAVIFADFNAIRELSAGDFVQRILRDKLNARRVYCGFNYRFGRSGSGDTEALRRLCGVEGIAVHVSEPVYVGDQTVSSTRVRALLRDGDLESANALLGYRYRIGGDIGSGNHIGSAMGFPTVNIPIGEGMAAPRFGVYASRLLIDGAVYRGATNIGVHPTVGENARPLCETFLLDFEGGDLYGRSAVCEPLRFIRPERRFDSLKELTVQVRQDCESIQKLNLSAADS